MNNAILQLAIQIIASQYVLGYIHIIIIIVIWFITRDASLQMQLYNANSYIYIVQNKKVATYLHSIDYSTDEPAAKASNNLDYNAQQRLAKYKKHINEN